MRSVRFQLGDNLLQQADRFASLFQRQPPRRKAGPPSREDSLRVAGSLGPEWYFSEDDRPHFVHHDGKLWLVYDEVGRWESWIGHRLVGRFSTLRQARIALRKAQRC